MFRRTSGRSTIRERTRDSSLGYPLGVAGYLMGYGNHGVQLFQRPKEFFFFVAGYAGAGQIFTDCV